MADIVLDAGLLGDSNTALSMSALWDLDSSLNGVSTLTNTFRRLRTLTSTLPGISTPNFVLRASRGLTGALNGVSVATSTIQLSRRLTVTGLGTATLTASVRRGRRIATNTVGTATLTPTISRSMRMLGVMNGSGSLGLSLHGEGSNDTVELMAARLFNVHRRAFGVVDLLINKVEGADTYRVKGGDSFSSGSFTDLFEAPATGFRDDAISVYTVDLLNNDNTCRVVFNPTTYSLSDYGSFWIQIVPVTAGVEGTGSAPTLILPNSSNHGVDIVVINGTAPNGTELNFNVPSLQDVVFTNLDGSNNLLVSVEEGGAQWVVLPNTGSQKLSLYGRVGSLWVSGEGGDVDFSMSGTLAIR